MKSHKKLSSAKSNAVVLHGLVRRMGRWMANRCGLLVVTPETMIEWTERSKEYNRVAGHYDLSDERLSGLNYGRSQTYLACCQAVQETNAPNALDEPSGQKQLTAVNNESQHNKTYEH